MEILLAPKYFLLRFNGTPSPSGLDQRRQDTILHHVTLTFLIFCLLKNYDDIRIQHGRHLPVDFCYTVYRTNAIRDV